MFIIIFSHVIDIITTLIGDSGQLNIGLKKFKYINNYQ